MIDKHTEPPTLGNLVGAQLMVKTITEFLYLTETKIMLRSSIFNQSFNSLQNIIIQDYIWELHEQGDKL